MDEMNMTNKAVLDKADELAHALIGSEIYLNMRRAEAEAMRDPEATKAFSDYMENKNALDELLQQEDPDGEKLQELAGAMEEIQQKMQAVPAIIAMSEAQHEFQHLIDQVNRKIHYAVTGEMGDEDEGCNGHCDGCSGCGHAH